MSASVDRRHTRSGRTVRRGLDDLLPFFGNALAKRQRNSMYWTDISPSADLDGAVFHHYPSLDYRIGGLQIGIDLEPVDGAGFGIDGHLACISRQLVEVMTTTVGVGNAAVVNLKVRLFLWHGVREDCKPHPLRLVPAKPCEHISGSVEQNCRQNRAELAPALKTPLHWRRPRFRDVVLHLFTAIQIPDLCAGGTLHAQ